jgi:hypothetical protein
MIVVQCDGCKTELSLTTGYTKLTTEYFKQHDRQVNLRNFPFELHLCDKCFTTLLMTQLGQALAGNHEKI